MQWFQRRIVAEVKIRGAREAMVDSADHMVTASPSFPSAACKTTRSYADLGGIRVILSNHAQRSDHSSTVILALSAEAY